MRKTISILSLILLDINEESQKDGRTWRKKHLVVYHHLLDKVLDKKAWNDNRH